MSMLAGGSRAAPRVVAVGEPVPLITDAQRALLGIKIGPDAPIDFFQAKDGRFYLNTAGALGERGRRGHPAAWDLHVDSGLTQILSLHSDAPARGPADVQAIMTDHKGDCGSGQRRLAASDSGGAACTQYFDRDYAGGGTYYRCPDGTSVYFYHGENHTAPDGQAGKGGWFGIGVGIFNADETAVTPATETATPAGGTSAQIIGVNLSTIWQRQGGAYATPPQANPFNGVPSAIPNTDGYLYVYHEDATLNPAYNPSACGPECPAVSRAPIAAFCASIKTRAPVEWRIYYRGGWTQPAMQDARSSLGYGSGGLFTPLIPTANPGEHGGTVTFIPSRHLYVMPRLYHGGIDVRTSSDGLNWSQPSDVVATPAGTTPYGDAETALYPRVCVLHSGGSEHYVLVYSLVTKGQFWRWAALMRQPLEIR